MLSDDEDDDEFDTIKADTTSPLKQSNIYDYSSSHSTSTVIKTTKT